MEQFDESARYFESALLRDTRSIPALAGLAQARFGMDDFSGADEAIGSLNDLHPELAERISETYGSGGTTRAGVEEIEVFWEEE